MKKVLSYLTVLSLLVMLIFVPSINAEAAQSRTINLGRLGLGQTVNRSLGIKLETPGSFGSRTLGGGLQLAEDPTGMLMVKGTTNAIQVTQVQEILLILQSILKSQVRFLTE